MVPPHPVMGYLDRESLLPRGVAMTAEVEITPTHITEAELAEHLSEILDRVANGERIAIKRDGEVIATLRPTPKPIATWGDVVHFLTRESPFDEEFVANVRRHREEQPQAQVPEWLE
jgi:antitoxin (DNA-binding transcriptional repressor) of toxin-antitoxin stability system